MSIDTAWPVPFIINPQNLAVDALVSFCVAVLLAVMINAEAQAFAAAFLGDSRTGAKDRFHFNAFLHLDLWGTICYLLGGFGWPRTMAVDPGKLKHPRLYTLIIRVAGPAANLLLASIAGSVAMIMTKVEIDPRVFLMLIGVNLTTAVYNLIPIPPLAGGVFVSALLPREMDRLRQLFNQVGPYLIVAILLLERIRGEFPFRGYLDPVVKTILNYITGF